MQINDRISEAELHKIENGYIMQLEGSSIKIVLDLGLTLIYDGFFEVSLQVADIYK